MKHVKKFEDFDFSQSIPMTTKNFLTNYYSCDECDALWKEYNKQSGTCKVCNSDEVEELPEDEWYEIAKSRMNDKELKELENEKIADEETATDLIRLNSKNKYME